MTNVAILVLCCFAGAFAHPGRIVGGDNALLGEYPHQASLRLGENPICAGSIIDQKTILTSASCVSSFKPEDLTVIVGTNALIGGGKSHSVESIIPHESFNLATVENDLAVLKVNPEIAFNKFTQAIEMAEEEVEAGQQLKVSGWGLTSYPGGPSNNLQTLKVSAISIEDCGKEFEGANVDEKNVCVQSKAGKGVCNGDSGSALVNGQKKQVGIVSWSVPCATGKPDVFTSTNYFRQWIEDHKEPKEE